MSNTSIESNQLSSKEAGRLLGYTHDYISKLCREGKMNGIQKGRVWYVTKQEVEDFKVRHEAELLKKKKLLSQKFSQMRSKHKPVNTSSQVTDIPKVELKDETPASDPASEIEHSVPSPFQLKFRLPKQITAALVLCFLFVSFSFLNAPVQNPQTNDNTVSSQTASINTSVNQIQKSPESSKLAGGIVPNIDQGIATVIGAQSELFLQTASVYSFVQYLSDGYWQLALSTMYLGKGVYGVLDVLTDGVFAVYQLQGVVLYNSMQHTSNMGTVAISFYELSGEAVFIGVQNALASYKEMLRLNTTAEVVSMHVDKYIANVDTGLTYATQGAIHNATSNVLLNIGEGLLALGNNLNTNFAYISKTLAQSRESISALIINSLSVDFSTSDGSIRKIEVK